MVRLSPGESVRILGSANLNPAWNTSLIATPTVAKMNSYLAVNLTQLRPAKSANGSTFRDNEMHL
jgi:hypothetical protein